MKKVENGCFKVTFKKRPKTIREETMFQGRVKNSKALNGDMFAMLSKTAH